MVTLSAVVLSAKAALRCRVFPRQKPLLDRILWESGLSGFDAIARARSSAAVARTAVADAFAFGSLVLLTPVVRFHQAPEFRRYPITLGATLGRGLVPAAHQLLVLMHQPVMVRLLYITCCAHAAPEPNARATTRKAHDFICQKEPQDDTTTYCRRGLRRRTIGAYLGIGSDQPDLPQSDAGGKDAAMSQPAAPSAAPGNAKRSRCDVPENEVKKTAGRT